MTRLFERRDRWGNGVAIWILVALLFCVPLIYSGVKQARLENDVESWLPLHDEGAQVLHWYDQHFERDERILVSWDDSSLNDPRLNKFVSLVLGQENADGERVGGIDAIAEVVTPQDVIARMREQNIPREDAVRRLEGVLVGTGAMRVLLTDRARANPSVVEQKLVEAARNQLGLELEIRPASFEPPPEAVVDADAAPADEEAGEDSNAPEEAAAAGEDEFARNDAYDPYPPLPRHDFQVRWKGMSSASPEFERIRALAQSLTDEQGPLIEDCFFAAGAPVALSLHLNPAYKEELRDTLKAIPAAAQRAGIDAAHFRMVGQPVTRSRLNQDAIRALWNEVYPLWQFHKRSPILLSCIVGVIASYLLLKSLRLATLVLVVSSYVAAASVALVTAGGSTMNMVLIVMPNLMLVITQSGAVHVAHYWRHIAQTDRKNAVSRAVAVAWMPSLLAGLTTAIGLATLATSSLIPVRDFGIYAGIGCLLAQAMVLLGFPAMLQLWGGEPGKDDEVGSTSFYRLGQWISRHGWGVTTGFIAVSLLLSGGLKWFRTETKAIRYFPEHTRVVQDYYFFEECLAGVVSVDTLVRFDEEAQERTNVLERLAIVRSVEDRIRAVAGISGTLALPDFAREIEPPADDASTFQKIQYRRALQKAETTILGPDADSSRQFVTVAEQPIEFHRGDHSIQFLPGEEIWRIRVQSGIMGDLRYEELLVNMDNAIGQSLRDEAGVEFVITGLVPLFLRTQGALLDSLINSFGAAFIIIAVMMMVQVRDFWVGVLCMIPNVLPVTTAFGMIAWAGIPLDIGTMITASVAMGLADDATRHLLQWYQDAIREGLPQSEALAHALGHCGPAIWQTCAAISIALLMLFGADLLLISRFGWLMALMIMISLFNNIILMPAMLAGPMGAILARAELRRGRIVTGKPQLAVAEGTREIDEEATSSQDAVA